VEITVDYSRYKLFEGQLVAIDENNKRLYDYIKNHPNFNEVRDDKLIKLAPPINKVMVPEEPYTMRKEDIVNELRSYGIAVDPYEFSQTLSMRLNVARKMLKRNFITVLNERGIPVFIDRLKLPAPVINKHDETLKEPESLTPEQIKKFQEENDEEDDVPVVVPHRKEEKEDDTAESAFVIEKSIDPFMQINKGKTFEQFIQDNLTFNERVDPEIEQITKPIRFENDPPTEFDDFEFTNMNQFLYLIEMQDRNFMVETEGITAERLDEEIKWSMLNIDIFEAWLRQFGFYPEYDESEVKKRWMMAEKAKEMYDKGIKKKKMRAELNALTLRHEELVKFEPDFRKFKVFSVKRRITELGKYGMKVSYSNEMDAFQLKKYGKKVYALCKLGLQAPEHEEDIDKKLLKYKRLKVLNGYK
jgi:hypothetical protein